MNWGKGITLVFLLFGLGMGFLVYKTTQKKSEMVTENYYQKELVYEQVIQGKRNVDSLTVKPSISKENSSVIIHFPESFSANEIKGEVYFYRADDVKKDRTIALALDTANTQQIPISILSTGNYMVQLTWNYLDKYYYLEENIFIP